jgi:predicted RecA/RadA family phage recombinase
MKSAIASGDFLIITATANILAGAGVLLGSLFGVATTDIANGAQGSIALTGIFDLPKVDSQTWTVGAPIYWTGTACTTVASTNKMIGCAAAAVGGGAGLTIGRVRLNGAAVTP